MIHISYSEGCRPSLGCSDDDMDDGEHGEDPGRGKRSDSSALTTLASCRAGLHPYDPGGRSSDVAGCVSDIDRALGRGQVAEAGGRVSVRAAVRLSVRASVRTTSVQAGRSHGVSYA
ncbi:hypothetical protein [Achromobacter aloeverae]|uniref:Uncharacterized protein n=1 Tax=Achromobacter aloeverae TaxID=1750518 RepID=A0A4Q1HMH5_9BURK|nr:hypothetical protein [Achromobacter aloeverae]RXN90397.1 hypothetical protein C7R54_12890 [Achromobacter aloeverae]